MERDYEQEVKDIESHIKALFSTAMFEDTGIDVAHHRLPYQVFRMIMGYSGALDKLKEQEFFTNAQFVIVLNDGEYSAHAKSPDGIRPGACAFGATAQEALSNVIRKIALKEPT